MLRWLRRKQLSQAQLWALASGGVLIRVNSEPFDKLASAYSPEACQRGLLAGWDVTSAEQLRHTFNWLWNEGHSRYCLELCESYFPRDGVIENAQVRNSDLYAFMATNLPALRSSRLIAWDLCRLIIAARHGYAAKYIQGTEAWNWIMKSARKLQKSFPSWKASGQDFVLGYEFWRLSKGATSDLNIGEAYRWLVSDPQSPWLRLDWNTPLSSDFDDSSV